MHLRPLSYTDYAGFNVQEGVAAGLGSQIKLKFHGVSGTGLTWGSALLLEDRCR